MDLDLVKSLLQECVKNIQNDMIYSKEMKSLNFDVTKEHQNIEIFVKKKDYAFIKNKQNNDLNYKFNKLKIQNSSKYQNYYTPFIKKLTSNFIKKYNDNNNKQSIKLNTKIISQKWSELLTKEFINLVNNKQLSTKIINIHTINGFINFQLNIKQVIKNVRTYIYNHTNICTYFLLYI